MPVSPFLAGYAAAAQFRRDFLGKPARSRRTGHTGMIVGGWIDTSTAFAGVRGTFELQTTWSKEQLGVMDIELLVEPALLTGEAPSGPIGPVIDNQPKTD